MEKRKECNIVQDLLLNYIDGVLTQDSKELVENHISTCKNCAEKLNDIKKDIEQTSEEKQEKEIDFFKNIKKKITNKNTLIIVIGIILAITVIFNIAVFINYSKEACKMKIYLDENITEEEIQNIEQIIKSEDENAEIKFNSKQDELDQLKEKMGEKQYLLEGVEYNIFPETYEIKSQPKYIRKIEERLLAISSVKKIATNVGNNPYLMIFSKFFVK